MPKIDDIAQQKDPNSPWRSLHIFNIYRLILTGIIAVIFFAVPADTIVFGASDRKLFSVAIIIWIGIALISGFASRYKKPGFISLVVITILIDITFVTILMYASGGISSGLGTLMLVTIAASGILLSGRISFAFAALATLVLLAVHSYSILSGLIPTTRGYTQIGLLGLGLFSVTLLAHTLAQRIRESESLAQQRGKALTDLSLVNDLIIQQMDIGVLVVDRNETVLLSNHAAGLILNFSIQPSHKLADISTGLVNNYRDWKLSSSNNLSYFGMGNESQNILSRFINISETAEITTAIFLEDAEQLAVQAQQAKLASLGRLTASIAHEIRNPLSAINHASELLAESEKSTPQDSRLLEIIRKQTIRLDTIVENILSLSRKETIQLEPVSLNSWIEDYLENKIIKHDVETSNIIVQCPDSELAACFDTGHLTQIMDNLVNNAVHHSQLAKGKEHQVTITCSKDSKTATVHLVIEDNGPGIEPANIKKIFEPFFTTESNGTGLGLYIAHVLSDLNNATLTYETPDHSGARFRLTVPCGKDKINSD